MYTPEVHRTVKKVQLLEQLDIDLTITDRTYQSDFESAGKLTVHSRADDQTIIDRRHSPWNPFSAALDLVSNGETAGTYPGTEMYIGLCRRAPVEQDDSAFQEDHVVEAVEVDGIPENGTVEFDVDWQPEEATESVSGDITRVDEREYDVSKFPSDQLPIIVRANLERDARRVANVLGVETDDLRGKQDLEGRATLTIEIEHREVEGVESHPLVIDGFRIELSRTFPDVDFVPGQGMSYDPESRRVEWVNKRVPAGASTTYAIIGPLEDLMEMEQVTASLRGEIAGRTLSGLQIADVYDQSGAAFGDDASADPLELEQLVKITADVEIDPAALRGKAKEVSEATVDVKTTPQDTFEELVRVCDRNGIHVLDRSPPGDGEPVANRDGVFDVEDNPGQLDVRREYGDEGVVYGGITVTGRFTAETETTEVSAFDDSEDRLVRQPEGGLGDRGRSTVQLEVRSTSSELNSRLISTIEDAFGGGTR